MTHFILRHRLLSPSEVLRNRWVKWTLNLLIPSRSLTTPPHGPVGSGHSRGRWDGGCRLRVLCTDLLSGLLFSCQSHSLPWEWTSCAVIYTQYHTKHSLSLSFWDRRGRDNTSRLFVLTLWIKSRAGVKNPGSYPHFATAFPVTLSQALDLPIPHFFLFYQMRISLQCSLILSGRYGCWKIF